MRSLFRVLCRTDYPIGLGILLTFLVAIGLSIFGWWSAGAMMLMTTVTALVVSSINEFGCPSFVNFIIVACLFSGSLALPAYLISSNHSAGTVIGGLLSFVSVLFASWSEDVRNDDLQTESDDDDDEDEDESVKPLLDIKLLSVNCLLGISDWKSKRNISDDAKNSDNLWDSLCKRIEKAKSNLRKLAKECLKN